MPLEKLERRQFMTKVRSALLERLKQGGRRTHQEVFGHRIGAATSTISMTRESGEDFNARRKHRALYGQYGKGGLEREKISSSERIQQMMEAGQTGRRRMMETGQTGRRRMMEVGATERTGITDVTTRRGQDLRFAPGDAFGPPGVERYKAETERMFPKAGKGMTPKYVSPQYDPITGEELSPAGMIERRQGGYYQVPVQKQGQERPLTIEEQKAWDELRKRQGLR